jgi:integrase
MKKRSRGNGEGTVYKRSDGGPYYVSWFDASGRRRKHCTKTTDLASAKRILKGKVANVALRRDGVVDPKLDAIKEAAAESIESHLSSYEAHLVTAHRDSKHIGCTLRAVRAIAKAAEWTTAGQIEPDGVNRYAADLKHKGFSARTVQAHLTAIKSFVRWLFKEGKLTHDPLATVTKPDPKGDRKRQRRMLLPAEWTWLSEATETGPALFGVVSQERRLLYCTAIQTGLRSNELRSLTRRKLHLAGDAPFIRVDARNTKNSKPARQYIKPDLARELARHIARKAHKRRCSICPHRRTWPRCSGRIWPRPSSYGLKRPRMTRNAPKGLRAIS